MWGRLLSSCCAGDVCDERHLKNSCDELLTECDQDRISLLGFEDEESDPFRLDFEYIHEIRNKLNGSTTMLNEVEDDALAEDGMRFIQMKLEDPSDESSLCQHVESERQYHSRPFVHLKDIDSLAAYYRGKHYDTTMPPDGLSDSSIFANGTNTSLSMPESYVTDATSYSEQDRDNTVEELPGIPNTTNQNVNMPQNESLWPPFIINHDHYHRTLVAEYRCAQLVELEVSTPSRVLLKTMKDRKKYR